MAGSSGTMSSFASMDLARISLCLLADVEWGVTDQAQMQVDLGDSGTLNSLLACRSFEHCQQLACHLLSLSEVFASQLACSQSCILTVKLSCVSPIAVLHRATS